MTGIKILGAQGSVSVNSYTTCIQVSKNTLIDAGNIMHSLGINAQYIENIFLSHAHLDHIIDSGFLMDNFLNTRKKSLKIYGLSSTIQAIKKHIFNWEIWPDFSKINIPGTKIPSVEFIEIEFEKTYQIEEGITLTPVEAVHTVPCCGYIISKENDSIYFSGDTYKNPKLWQKINQDSSIKALIIDVSFPNALERVASESKHLTPQSLKEDMSNLQRDDIQIYISHLKPLHKKEITKELKEIGIKKKNILHDGEFILFKSGEIIDYNDSMQHRINKLNNIGIALSAESNLDKLLELIVMEAKEITHADGGTLYLLDDSQLHFTVVQTDSMDIKMGGTNGAITLPPLALYLEEGVPNKKMVAAMCALEDTVINIPDVYEAKGFSFDGTKKFDASTGYRSKSMLVIPLRDHEKKVIGVLQLINKQNPLDTSIEHFNKHDENITLSLASQAAVAITNVKLIAGLEELLEAFLKSIIFAISKKSPYTAGHIKRMVELSVMMAKKVHEDTTVFKEKKFSEEEIKQINFAALMHDIGKLATPEQIMDKATKLEAIYDRVELVLSRIEIIKREFEIAYLKKHITQEVFATEIQELITYQNIIKKSNTGSEFFSDEEVAKVEKIQAKRYKLNNQEFFILTEDEAYNLCVQKGTLTSEQRDIINKHAKISVDILDKLPFPTKYKEIPQISGNHHEKINGKGYPKGLKRDEISFEARILAIADIFEALTASDRPYKKANPLSFAMKILYFMAKDDEIDKELVKFFYNSGLYLKYAQLHLPESSIDKVEINFNSL